jgi:hypothetical protein
LRASKAMRASVRSVAALSSLGSNIRKSVIGAATLHAASPSSPSMAGGCSARAAMLTARALAPATRTGGALCSIICPCSRGASRKNNLMADAIFLALMAGVVEFFDDSGEIGRSGGGMVGR